MAYLSLKTEKQHEKESGFFLLLRKRTNVRGKKPCLALDPREIHLSLTALERKIVFFFSKWLLVTNVTEKIVRFSILDSFMHTVYLP